MKISEHVTALSNALEDVIEHLEVIDQVKEARAAEESGLEAVKQQHEAALASLRTAKADLDRVQSDLQDKTSMRDAEHTKALKAVQANIAAAQAEHANLTSLINSKRNEHDQILASVESLRKKFA